MFDSITQPFLMDMVCELLCRARSKGQTPVKREVGIEAYIRLIESREPFLNMKIGSETLQGLPVNIVYTKPWRLDLTRL